MTANGTGGGKARQVKCVVWDLDGTIWDGVLLEDPEVATRADVIAIIRALDEVGILHSISSKNDHELAMRRLAEAGIADYFLYPQITWNAKSDSIQTIAKSLNIGMDALAFVDDQDFELAEVAHALPEVLLVPAGTLAEAVGRPEFRPRFVTSESRQRRLMYQADATRDVAEQEYRGTSEEFLATLDMRMRISPAGPDDLPRAEELTVRTNQLNSTGRTFGFEELDALRTSPDHLLLVASLDDRFGSYGTIGLALLGTAGPAWRLHLLLTSCRVVSRGVGTVLLNHAMRLAGAAGARFQAEFVHTGRNRMMYLTYKMAGFREVDGGNEADGVVLLESSLDHIQPAPPYLTLDLG
jgi:FkbH-like protein